MEPRFPFLSESIDDVSCASCQRLPLQRGSSAVASTCSLPEASFYNGSDDTGGAGRASRLNQRLLKNVALATADLCQIHEDFLEACSKNLLNPPDDIPTDERAAEFEERFVNVRATIEANA
ncbi:hypothetical protein AB9075_07285 [Burkholderia thailandensis]|uniref:hypothetical protein n=1 Tax=Burkholderia thailandensis TaxID=57975 RepID=UPI003B507AF3